MSLDHLLGSISPQSPYYKDEGERFTCLICFHDFDINAMIVTKYGTKVCNGCNDQLEENEIETIKQTKP